MNNQERNRPASSQLVRAKVEVRNSGSQAGLELTDASQLQSALNLLSRGEQEIGDRQESRFQAQRELYSGLLCVLLRIDERLARCENMVVDLHQIATDAKPPKDWYSVKEVSEILGKAEFTVREWCRLGRVNAAKRDCGRGNSQEWIVSLDELKRIQNEGLLPD